MNNHQHSAFIHSHHSPQCWTWKITDTIPFAHSQHSAEHEQSLLSQKRGPHCLDFSYKWQEHVTCCSDHRPPLPSPSKGWSIRWPFPADHVTRLRRLRHSRWVAWDRKSIRSHWLISWPSHNNWQTLSAWLTHNNSLIIAIMTYPQQHTDIRRHGLSTIARWSLPTHNNSMIIATMTHPQ